MLMEGIILTCCQQITAKRTTAAIYHILTGKRSIQTMQDIHIYELQAYYGVAKSLSKHAFQQLIQQLEYQHLLDFDEKNCFQLTAEGREWLHTSDHTISLTSFNGLAYHKLASVFSDRLLLIIQTVTNSRMGNLRFIPIIHKKPVQMWVKSFYKMVKPKEIAFIQSLYTELHSVLSGLSELEANLFVDRLTGYHTYGKSQQQLAEQYHIEPVDIPLIWTKIIHYMLHMIQQHQTNHPALYAIISDYRQVSLLTDTAKKTYRLLKQQHTLDKIAAIRGLKVNTIYDHVVEIALADSTFAIDPFVSNEQYQAIMEAIQQIDSFSLKQIKENVAVDISYFQIRLVLAMIKQK
ncbi:helix-turn-helix domain-containing protein [Lentibacillus sp. N15]|uniref:helix-turn-helix domain-containing protein n=1 Tax=Lentibacillus songyuanensis TaxID=3136161 RepID=UPI0031BA07BB